VSKEKRAETCTEAHFFGQCSFSQTQTAKKMKSPLPTPKPKESFPHHFPFLPSYYTREKAKMKNRKRRAQGRFRKRAPVPRFPSIFKGCQKSHRTPQKMRRSASHCSLSPDNLIPGTPRRKKEKETNLSPFH